MEPAPINSYGASKLFGERVGKMFAEHYGVSFIAFRIGVCQRANDNLQGPWSLQLLGPGDVGQRP